MGRRTALRVGGIALVVVGVILMPVPVLPGIPVVVAGAALIRKARRPSTTVTNLPEPSANPQSEAASA